MGYRVKRLRLLLPIAMWDELINYAAANTADLATAVAIMARLGLDTCETARVELAPVYYDAQGREHEEADVR
jgi:hypothetical protein